MSESSASKVTSAVDDASLDETLKMPVLDQMLAASEETLGEVRQWSEDPAQMVLIAQLNRLVELSESIEARLGQIADLLAHQRPRSSAASRRKTASNKVVEGSLAMHKTSATG